MMTTLPTSPERTVGVRDGFPWGGAVPEFLVLDPPREFMRYCAHCEYSTCFIARFELANGLLGHCSECEDWCVVPYTRTVE